MSGDEAYWWLGEENGTELIQTTDGWSDLLLSHRNGLCLATSASSRAKGNQRDKLLFEHNITWHYQPRLAGHRVWKVLRYPCIRQSEWWQQGNAYQRQTGLLIKSAIVHVRHLGSRKSTTSVFHIQDHDSFSRTDQSCRFRFVGR